MTNRLENRTINRPRSLAPRVRLEDMRLFAEVASARSFTAAARRLGLPKQTLSRRIAELEDALDVPLLHRTTRKLHVTEAGAAYAERCSEIARLADDANRAVTETSEDPRGVLRVTADPTFGGAFVAPLVVEYARRFPAVHVDVTLTQRRVDLVEEGFDVAFRVGRADDPRLTATELGPARVRYCASPSYVAEHGRPRSPSDLASHECIILAEGGAPARWPFRGKQAMTLVPVAGRVRVNSFAMAYAAALGGLGIGLFPRFTCKRDIAKRRLVSLLDDWVVDVGAVWLVHPTARYLVARVRAFVALALERLAKDPPWE